MPHYSRIKFLHPVILQPNRGFDHEIRLTSALTTWWSVAMCVVGWLYGSPTTLCVRGRDVVVRWRSVCGYVNELVIECRALLVATAPHSTRKPSSGTSFIAQ